MNLTALFSKTEFRRYTGNTVWLLGERLTQTGLAFVVGIFIARTLGPDAFGQLNFAISYGLLFAILTSWGTDQVVVDELVRHPEQSGLILGSALTLRLGGFLLMVLLVAGSALLCFPTGTSRYLILIILTGYLGAALNGIDGYFQANVIVGKTSRVVIVNSVVFALLNLAGCYFKFSLYFFAVTNSAIVLSAAAGKLLVFRREFGSIPLWRGSLRKMRELLSRSGWIFAQMVLTGIAANVGYLILKAVCSDESVGFYAVTAKLLTCSLIFPEVLALSLFPAIITAADRPGLFELRLARLYAAAFWGGMLAVAVAFLLGEPVITLFYGSRYAESGRLLWIAMLALPLNAVFMVFSRWCVIRDQQALLFIQALSGAVSAAVLTWMLSRAWGLAGAVWSLPANALVQFLALTFCPPAGRRQQWFICRSLMLHGVMKHVN